MYEKKVSIGPLYMTKKQQTTTIPTSNKDYEDQLATPTTKMSTLLCIHPE